MQQSVSIDEPDFGALLDDMIFENGAEIPTRRFIRPRIEMELAFVLGEAVTGPGCTAIDILRAAEFVVPALEILDARVQMTDPETGHGRTIVDTIADNAADAGVVLGSRPAKPLESRHRLGGGTALPQRGDRGVRRGRGRAAPSGQQRGVARQQAGRLRRPSRGRPDHPVPARSSVRCTPTPATSSLADYGPLGTITCRFAAEPPGAPAEER